MVRTKEVAALKDVTENLNTRKSTINWVRVFENWCDENGLKKNLETVRPPGGGGGTPLYGLYRYVRRQRVWFFGCFGHKQGIAFSHFAAILVINRV